ncbi:hypothetical protein SAMN05443574_105110 [Haloarcula vallismortis]|uniref:Uncharacterized protein n=1 Tax=Haloarcula vallismortis TaxID=28442 RepID=A0A1H2V3M7_HALVA|nr:hypothetical protein SAMN05443574_105110 [Haloarcula vallismortis]
MDLGHQLIETGSQSGKSAKAVTVQSGEVETANHQLISHYSTDCAEIQGASVGGQSR